MCAAGTGLYSHEEPSPPTPTHPPHPLQVKDKCAEIMKRTHTATMIEWTTCFGVAT